MKAKLSAAAIAVGFAAVVGVPVMAMGHANPHANAQAQAAGANPSTGQPSNPGSQGAEHRANAQAKLADTKLRVCENRQKAITNILSRISDRGQKQYTLFGTIATRVETFYTDKGKTLSNYDALVADVNAKQAVAKTTVDSVESASTGFSCEGNDPQGFVSTFKGSLKSEISALQDYRTSVKNLIVGVKSVQGTTTSAANQGGGNQ